MLDFTGFVKSFRGFDAVLEELVGLASDACLRCGAEEQRRVIMRYGADVGVKLALRIVRDDKVADGEQNDDGQGKDAENYEEALEVEHRHQNFSRSSLAITLSTRSRFSASEWL